MNNLKRFFLTPILLLLMIFSFGQSAKNQTTISQALAKETIKNQLDILIKKSPEFQGFNNLRKTNLSKFKANFNDTLKAIEMKFSKANTIISSQKSEISKLKSEIETINNNLTKITSEKDSVNLFGLQMTKNTYNVLLWSIIGALLATTLLLLFKFNTSNRTTKQTKTSFTEIENEFETHKKSSLEREQVLRRKLQDEINKQRNVN